MKHQRGRSRSSPRFVREAGRLVRLDKNHRPGTETGEKGLALVLCPREIRPEMPTGKTIDQQQTLAAAAAFLLPVFFLSLSLSLFFARVFGSSCYKHRSRIRSSRRTPLAEASESSRSSILLARRPIFSFIVSPSTGREMVSTTVSLPVGCVVSLSLSLSFSRRPLCAGLVGAQRGAFSRPGDPHRRPSRRFSSQPWKKDSTPASANRVIL